MVGVKDMENFRTEIMSDAVDKEQERLALIDEVRELKDEVRELEFNMGENHLSYQTQIVNLTRRAKAWDDLEALVELRRPHVTKMSYFRSEYVCSSTFGECSRAVNLAAAVSNALTSIRGES